MIHVKRLKNLELMLADHGGENGDPFVVELSKPKFTNVLKYFKRLLTYSNVRYDVPVHYSTAAIRLTPFDPASIPSIPPIYPMIFSDKAHEPIPSLKDDSYEATILRNLSKLEWKRYAVITERPLLAHVDIIIKSVVWNKHGFPIIAHIVDHFRHYIPKHTRHQSQEEIQAETVPLSPLPTTGKPAKLEVQTSDFFDGVHLIILIHGLNKRARDLMPLIECIRDAYPRPMYKIVAPDYPHQPSCTQSSVIAWLFEWTNYQIAHSFANRISIVSQDVGGIYACGLVQQMHKLKIQTKNMGVEYGSFITIDTDFGDQTGNAAMSLLMNSELRCVLSEFKNLVCYCSIAHPHISSLQSGLALPENAEISEELDQDDSFWRTVLVSCPSIPVVDNESTSTDGQCKCTNEAMRNVPNWQNISTLPWKRVAILPSKSHSSSHSQLYWNNEKARHLIGNVIHLLSG